MRYESARRCFQAAMAVSIVVLLAAGAATAAPWRGHDRHWHGGGHVSVEVGPLWWGPWGPYWYSPYGPYDPWYYNRYPSVIVEEPRMYVEQPQIPAPPTEGYWYYCPSSRAYYPTVPTCPEAWVKVPPRPE